MGDCKDNMKTTDLTKKDSKDSVLGKLLPKRRREEPEEKAKTFADHVVAAENKLSELIVKKEAELSTEKGREEYNRKALSYLKSMAFHIDEICNLASEYSELK